ncbi:hypothetical protein SATRI_v1c00360 [Spiroplasma atrichopogonis]|nr:hypothetical protein SATRI_v1c00360 [Spiroplasma atrichopogonis]
MEFLASDNSNALHDFVAISQWQSLVSIVIFFLGWSCYYYESLLKKLKFVLCTG